MTFSCSLKPASAAPGQHKVSGAWGSVQEASALHALLGLLGPGGPAMEEAGLFWLEPAPLEAAYGLPPGSLPPMGASPDALLRHGALPPALHGAAPGLRPSPHAPVVGAPAGAAGPPGRETLQGFATGAGVGIAAGACSGERGQAAGAARVWGPGVGFGPAACEGAGGDAAGCGEGLRLPGGAAGVEPVEVKSTCPFQQRVRRSRKGHQTRVYAVADRGPMQHVRASALCGGLRSVHRSSAGRVRSRLTDACVVACVRIVLEHRSASSLKQGCACIGARAVRAAAAAGVPGDRRPQRAALQPLRNQGLALYC